MSPSLFMPDRTLRCGVHDLHLSVFSEADIPDIVNLESEASKHPWPRSHFASSLNAGDLCLGLRNNKDGWLAHAVFSAACEDLELLILAVKPTYQRKGLARTLIMAVADALGPQFVSMLLEVRRSNKMAIKCYESIGFKKIGERKNYYRCVLPSEPASGAMTSQACSEDALLFRLVFK